MHMLIRGLGVLGLLAIGSVATADEQPQPTKKAPRVAVAKLATESGSVFRRESEDKPWTVVKKGEELFTGDLVVGLPGASVDSLNGAFRLTFRADLTRKSPFPILESAVVLRQKDGLDFDFYLDRGRVDVMALTDKKARFSFGWAKKDVCRFDVEKKGTTVLLETYARWAPGVHFDPKSPKAQEPLSDLVLLVTRGEVLACTSDAEVLLQAPPGPALIVANNQGMRDQTPRFVEKLPDWLAEDEKDSEVVAALARRDEFRKLILEKGPAGAIDAFLASNDPRKVRLAIIAMCATDDVERLQQAFYTTRSPEVLELCITVLRHWLGRDAAHRMEFYNTLIANKKITPTQAITVIQLLQSFDEHELAQVETYETLVSYLRHQALGIRALALYHLVRLYPQGKAFGYNPAGTEEERAAAVAKWRGVLADGKLPPKK